MQRDRVVRDLLFGGVDEVRDQTSQHGLMRHDDHRLRGSLQLEDHRLQSLDDIAVALAPPSHAALFQPTADSGS